LKVPDNLADQIASGLERRSLDRLGLENKAGNLIWGHERVGEALLKGKVRLLLHAADAKPDGMGKLEARRRGASPDTVSIVLPVGRDQLSMALGRENVVHAAIGNTASAARVIETLERWAAFNGTPVRYDEDEDDEEVDSAVADVADERH
jgi:ribosomal protein L7Ae-like RNA K-turn-binding protein